jgi:hypothetical protein
MAQAAPPAEQQANPNAVAPMEIGGPLIEVAQVAVRGKVTRIETVVALPAGFQYAIRGSGNPGTAGFIPPKVGITSDGYDYINRVLGVSFWLPEKVVGRDGAMANNPIHDANGYVYIRMAGVWYNEAGQMVATVEDIEVDPKWILAGARVESYDSIPALDDNKQPIFDAFGFPLYVLKDAAAERKAMKAYMQARTMGIRYAQTVARTRIMKVATGLKTLGRLTSPRDVTVRVVGYRDEMTPVERQDSAKRVLSNLFGQEAPEVRRLSHTELQDIEVGGTDDDLDQAVNQQFAADEADTQPSDNARVDLSGMDHEADEAKSRQTARSHEHDAEFWTGQ